MNRQAVCNLLATLSYPPWTEDLDREVYMTPRGEKRIPFHVYVQTSTISRNSSGCGTAIPQFHQLPQELQLRILTMCSASTLFQLMHTSAGLRIEASKLFWARQDAYFLVEARWLLENAYPGCTFWDMAFLPYVQNVEVEYTPDLDSTICPRDDETIYIKQDCIDLFWDSLKRRFPKVKRVVLNYNSPKQWEDENELFPLALQLLLKASPRDIKSSTLCMEEVLTPPDASATNRRTVTWRRAVFQPSTILGLWDEREPDKFRKTVMMPPRHFRGPVGQFRKFQYLCYTKIPLQRFGLWPLMVEAIDRHYFDAGRNRSFTCPLSSCMTRFYKAGAWSIHAAECHFQEWEGLLEAVPGMIKAKFDERNQDLDRKTKEVHEQFRKIRNAWELNNGARQSEIERNWMEQLASDNSWETKQNGEQSELWYDFLKHMDPDY